MNLTTFRSRYDAWLLDVKPLLLEANWKAAFKTYPFIVNEDAPWTPFSKPLAECRVGLVTTAGLYCDGEHEPFDAANIEGDWSHREIPVAYPTEKLLIAHEHFNHDHALEDLNTVYPVESLRELAAEGVIGDLVSPVISISGYCPPADRLIEKTAPLVVEALRAAGADIVLQVPV